jgi:F-type H+-transporting ATPase subunit c
MEGDIASMGQFIGAGLAAIGSGARRHRRGQRGRQLPGGRPAQPVGGWSQTATLFIGLAFAEALGIFAFLVALLLMFAV